MKLMMVLAAFMLTTPSIIQAAIIFSNDFNAETVGSAPSAPFGAAGLTGITAVRAADTNFGTQYWEVASRSDNGNFFFPRLDSTAATAVTTFSFDGRFNTADFGTFGTLRLRGLNIGLAEDQTRFDLNSAAGIVFDAVNHYDYAINNTGAAVAIENLGGTLAADSWAFYQNGIEIASGGTHTTATQGTVIDRLSFWILGDNTGPTQSFARIDNVEIRDNAFALAAVPEPSTFALVWLGMIGLFVRRRLS